MRRHAARSVRTFLLVLLLAATAAAAPRFGAVTVEGNTSTSTSLILHELPFAEGDPFSFELLDTAWEHLEDLGWFAYVDLEYDDMGGEVVPVNVVVEEDRTTRWYPIIDYDRRWDVQFGARVYDINFGGRGERLEFEAVWYRPHRYRVVWDHPWLFGVRGLSIGLEGVWEDADFVWQDLDFTRWETAARLHWNFASRFFVEAGAGLGAFDQQGDVTGFPVAWTAAERDRVRWRGVLGWDDRDPFWYPTRGMFHRLIAERVDGDGFEAYTALTADLRAFVQLPWDHVLAARAWGRRVDGHVPPEDALWWGGPGDLRGYDYASVVGEEGFLLGLEYRLPLFLMTISGDGRVIGVGLHAFGDAGANWWDGGTRDPLYSWGGGAHINISDHQFRFEVAVTEDGDTSFQFLDAFNF